MRKSPVRILGVLALLTCATALVIAVIIWYEFPGYSYDPDSYVPGSLGQGPLDDFGVIDDPRTHERDLRALHGTESEIEEWLLGMAPIGSLYSDVLKLVEERDWDIEWTRQITEPETPVQAQLQRLFHEVDGTLVLHVYLGGYLPSQLHESGFPWEIAVDCFWGFDDEENLIDLNVRSMADSP